MAEDALAGALKKRRQISITVMGRRSGRAITLPVWFVFEEDTLWLLPVYGSKTQWYRNLLVTPAITVQTANVRRRFQARVVREARAVRRVIGRFGEKYTPEQIARWYTGLDVAVEVKVRRAKASDSPPRRRVRRGRA